MMNPKDRAKIDKCLDQIVEKLDMAKLWTKLFEYEIFYEDDHKNIDNWTPNLDDPETMRDILLTIKTRGPHAYSNLLRSLKDTHQDELCEMLENCDIQQIDKNNSSNNIINHCNYNNNDTNGAEHESSSSSEINRTYLHQLAYDPLTTDDPLKVVVQKATKFYESVGQYPVSRYPMKTSPRGLVLIITLIKYLKCDGVRNAADHDEKNLIDLFEQMGFKVFHERDLTAAQIKEKVKEFSQKKEFRFVDSCFVIISGHGDRCKDANKSIILGIDHFGSPYSMPDGEVLCDEIISYFSAENCENLRNKPKIFIFQTCRGQKHQKAVPRMKSDCENQCSCLNGNHEDTHAILSGRSSTSTVRNYSDILIAHSTLPGYVSFRDGKTGTWFYQVLCEVFMRFAHNTHASDLFDIIDERLKSFRYKDGCQTSSIVKMGFGHCYINPGLFADDT